MSITIKKFKISNDRKSIDVDIEVGAGFTISSLTLWNESNYKDPSNNVDLSFKIDGSTNTETFVISNNEAGVSEFNGIYFLEVESNDPSDNPAIVATLSLTRYYGVIAGLLCNINLSCLNCNDNFQNALLLDMYVEAMKNAIELGRFQDAILFLNRINIFTESQCSECCNISPVVSTAGNIVSVGVIDCVLATV